MLEPAFRDNACSSFVFFYVGLQLVTLFLKYFLGDLLSIVAYDLLPLLPFTSFFIFCNKHIYTYVAMLTIFYISFRYCHFS